MFHHVILPSLSRLFRFPEPALTYPIRPPTASALFVDDETRIQVLDTMARLPRADKEQCAAFIVSKYNKIK